MITKFSGIGFEWASDKIARRFKEEKDWAKKEHGKLKDLISREKKRNEELKKKLEKKINDEIKNLWSKIAKYPDFAKNTKAIAEQATRIEKIHNELINIREVSNSAYNFAIQIQESLKKGN